MLAEHLDEPFLDQPSAPGEAPSGIAARSRSALAASSANLQARIFLIWSGGVAVGWWWARARWLALGLPPDPRADHDEDGSAVVSPRQAGAFGGLDARRL